MRKVLFWMHLTAGVIIALFIIFISATGTLLVFDDEIISLAERSLHAHPVSGQVPLPTSKLVASAVAQTHSNPQGLVLHSDASFPLELTIDRRGKVLLVDRYSGNLLGDGAARTRALFPLAEDLHRFFGFSGAMRDRAHNFKGAINLIFSFMLLSGLYLWLPRKATWRHLRQIVFFRGGLSGKAREWNWHNVAGIWLSIPLVIIVFTGVCMSYPAINSLVYRAANAKEPARGPRPGMQGGPMQGRPGGEPAMQGGQPMQGPAGMQGRPEGGPGGGPEMQAGRTFSIHELDNLDATLQRATQQLSDWKKIGMQFPDDQSKTITFVLTRGHDREQIGDRLTLDRNTGEVESWQPFSERDRGEHIRALIRFLHTGQIFGVAPQIIALLATLAAILLSYTGISLAIRRGLAYQKRIARIAEAESASLGSCAESIPADSGV